jgi:hypothetical protein
MLRELMKDAFHAILLLDNRTIQEQTAPWSDPASRKWIVLETVLYLFSAPKGLSEKGRAAATNQPF